MKYATDILLKIEPPYYWLDINNFFGAYGIHLSVWNCCYIWHCVGMLDPVFEGIIINRQT